jgi:hypothetical protein
MALPVNQGGSFIFFLDTHGAGLGSYTLTAQATESASVTLLLAENAPRHAQGGGGQTFALAGIAPVKARLIFLPVIRQVSRAMNHDLQDRPHAGTTRVHKAE